MVSLRQKKTERFIIKMFLATKYGMNTMKTEINTTNAKVMNTGLALSLWKWSFSQTTDFLCVSGKAP